MNKELEKVMIEDVEYSFDPEKEYIKDGHAYCKVCHERKDGKALEFFGKQMIFKTACKCDRDREAKEKERQKQLEIERLKSSCFTSIIQWSYTFENYQGKENQSLIIAKNFVQDYALMKKENIGLLFYGTVGSGKTYLACSIANALIEQYQISVKIRNFSQIINELQKGGFDLDKNAYIESLVNTSVLILDDLGIERDTSYAKEQVYNIVNNRYLKHKPTIFTTNLSYSQIENCTESVEYQRIYSRIIEMCIPVMVLGEDYRKVIQEEKLKRNKERLLTGGEDMVKKGQLEEIPVEEAELKELKKELNQYGVKFSVMKDKESGKYSVFFQAKDMKIMDKAFKHALSESEKKTERKESIHKNIEKFKEMAKNTVSKDKVKNKQKEQSL